MAIYKSSFNKEPEKKPKIKEKVEKPEKPKKEKVKAEPKTQLNIKINWAAIWLAVCVVVFVLCLFPNPIRHVLLGVVGLSIYPICFVGAFFAMLKLARRQFAVKKRYVGYLIAATFICWFVFHLIMLNVLKISMNSYGEHLAATYRAQTTAGGLIFSLLSYPIVKLITFVGAYIFSAIALAIIVGLIVDYIYVDKTVGHKEVKTKFDFNTIEDFGVEKQSEPLVKETPIIKQDTAKIAKQKLGIVDKSDIISSDMPQQNYNQVQTESRPSSKRDYILTPIEPVIPPENEDDLFLDSSTGYYNSKKIKRERAEEIKPVENAQPQDKFSTAQFDNADAGRYDDIILEDDSTNFDGFVELSSKPTVSKDDSQTSSNLQQKTFSDSAQTPGFNQSNGDNLIDDDDILSAQEHDILDEQNDDILSAQDDLLGLDDEPFNKENNSTQADEEIDNMEDLEQEDGEAGDSYEEITETMQDNFVDEYSAPRNESLGNTNNNEVVRPSLDLSKFHLPNTITKPVEPEQLKIEPPKEKLEIPPYVAPPVELLKFMETKTTITDEQLQENVERLEQVLADFKVPAKVNNVQVGPAVTRYELSMPRGISVNKIVTMADDIAMTLASNGAIRVEAPIPGKNSVGIEVPNNTVTPVSLRELIDSNEFRVRANPMSFVLGKDINGDIIFCNLDKMPHLLVAGSTGSGKSVCLNTMLLSMCYKCGPQDLRLILVDPKMVEFSTYNGLPHLLIPEVITNKDMTINALDWAIKEMERRYALFAKNRVVNINEFNKSVAVKTKREDKLPFIVVVVDELADLMLEAKKEIEDRIAKLAAKARAAGIHLVLATQRPSVDVITGTVKTNLPSRIAFALTNFMDSRTVLDQGGAEKLLGKGDMLFKPQDKPEPRRVQGAFVSSEEINAVVEYIKTHNKPVYDEDAGRAIKSQHSGGDMGGDDAMKDQEMDPIFKDVLRMFIETKQASTSVIQRRYSVGYNRAGRILEQMERAGFVSAPNGSKPRQVLINMDEYKALFGED